jgi:hypothetical protein
VVLVSESFDRVDERILRNGQYLLVSYSGSVGGAKNPSQDMFTGFRVVKHNVTTLYYNLATEVPNFLPMAPYGTSPGSTNSPPYIDNFSFSLQEVKNVTDMFKITNTGDAYQVFYGISPSYLRVVNKVQQQFVSVLEQNIYPSNSFVEMGVDGFQSPLYYPSAKTEFIVFVNLTYNVTLMNMAPIPIIPSFNFVINRMILEPLGREELRKAILAGFPIRSLGAVDSSIVISGSNYPGLVTLSYRDIYGG